MSQTPSNLFLSIGKPVKDEYGRSVGRIISFGTSPSGKFESAFIELSDGRFTKQPMENLHFNGAEITLLSQIKSKASVLCDQIPFIWRKDNALKDLNEKRKISPALYTELHNNFSTVLSQLRKDAQILLDEAIQGITRCEEELSTLSYSLLHLELEHEIGKITDDVYRSAYAALQETLKRTSNEKNDLEAIKNKLSSMLLGDAPPPPTTSDKKPATYTAPANPVNNETTELPEPPVVVYVKEVGKAGI
jgi:hypothetical protein